MIYVNFILDESGSMYIVEKETVKSINSYVKELSQNKNAKDIRFSLVRFNGNKVEIYYDKAKLKNVKEISDYSPNGSTPLYDAIGDTISNVPENATESVLVVLTDGEENSSHEHTFESIIKLIENKKELGWKFVFLATGLTEVNRAVVYAAGVNLNFNTTYSGVQDSKGICSVMNSAVLDTMNYVDSTAS